MTTDPAGLMLGHLRAIRGDTPEMADAMRTMSAEMAATRPHLAGVITRGEHDHGDIAVIETRLDRIERRLELAD